ncbi:hypothetical protein TWF281_008246 [Arthrobotrys megalospora]
MQPPLRIAILETESPTPDFQSKYGSYGDLFIRLLSSASITLNTNPPFRTDDLQFSKWDVERSLDYYPDIEEVDALLVVGHQDHLGPTSMDSTPWIIKLVDFVRKVLMEQDRVRVIGVNYGQLIVGRALGCAIDRMPGWEVSSTTINLSEVGKKVFGRDHLSLMQLHRDHVVTLPVNPFPQLPNAILEILGDSDHCAVQGLYTPRKVIALQGLPELESGMMTQLIHERLRQGQMAKDVANDAASRTSLRNDGVHIGMAFLRFLLEP